ncbi:hypothetical protein [uncultured Eudoraea sp.]|uniref:hypothetical protein n=1 Tax=uncultured Eudoraea sp. TaxID=1035614 RepID=UPI00260CFEF2|nr:hypothetical protein [uncultured Eudoraea sp.]
MYIFRLIIVLALLSFDLSSNKYVILAPKTSTEVADIDPCLLGTWRVDIPSMSIALDRPVSGSILVTFETSPVNEITASFDVTITRRPPQSATKRRVHSGSLSATMEIIDPDNHLKKFKLIRLELGEENSHKRYKADGDWVDIENSTEEFFRNTTFVYSDCSASMLIGMYAIKLNKEP